MITIVDLIDYSAAHFCPTVYLEFTFFQKVNIRFTKWFTGKKEPLLLRSFSSTPVRRIWFSPSKHIVNINSCSGSSKLFHKSMSPHHGFLIFFDAQVRSGNTLYWTHAFSVSWTVHFQNRHIYICRLLIFAESSNACHEMHTHQWRCATTFWLSRWSESDIIHSTSWPLPF